jgi:hypothetical protein
MKDMTTVHEKTNLAKMHVMARKAHGRSPNIRSGANNPFHLGVVCASPE